MDLFELKGIQLYTYSRRNGPGKVQSHSVLCNMPTTAHIELLSRSMKRSVRFLGPSDNWNQSFQNIGKWCRESSVSIMITLGTGRPRNLVSSPGRGKILPPFAHCPDRLLSTPRLPGPCPRYLSGRAMKMTTLPQITPRLRIHGAIRPLLHISSCCDA
jgi:hypothetical protein